MLKRKNYHENKQSFHVLTWTFIEKDISILKKNRVCKAMSLYCVNYELKTEKHHTIFQNY